MWWCVVHSRCASSTRLARCLCVCACGASPPGSLRGCNLALVDGLHLGRLAHHLALLRHGVAATDRQTGSKAAGQVERVQYRVRTPTGARHLTTTAAGNTPLSSLFSLLPQHPRVGDLALLVEHVHLHALHRRIAALREEGRGEGNIHLWINVRSVG
jgi:hypothetical protein